MVSPFSNATACGAIANGAYGLCKQVSLDCPKKMDSLEATILLIAIPLIVLSLSRVLGAAGYSAKSLSLCCQRCKEKKPRAIYMQVEEGSGDSKIYHPTHVSRIAKISHKAFSMMALATSLATIVYVMIKLPLSLQSKYCPDSISCIAWGNQSYRGCELAQDWLIEVIKELIQGNSFSPAD